MRATILVLLLLLALPSAAAQVLPRPVWSPGDSWSYVTDDGERIELKVAEAAALSNGTANVTALHVTNTVRAANGTTLSRTSVWYRASDGARLRETSVENGTTVTRSYPGGCIETPFPLRAGDAWSVDCVADVLETGKRVALRYNGSARAVENVTVPVGEFTTMLVVRELASGEVREHWSSDACHWVRREGPRGVSALRAFECASSGVTARPGTPSPSPSPSPAPTPAPALVLTLVAIVAIALARREASR